MLKQTRLLNTELSEFNSRCLNDSKLKHVNSTLMSVDWIGLLTGTTSNQKFNQFSDKVESVLDEVATVKKVRISAKKKVCRTLDDKKSCFGIREKAKTIQKDSIGHVY